MPFHPCGVASDLRVSNIHKKSTKHVHIFYEAQYQLAMEQEKYAAHTDVSKQRDGNTTLIVNNEQNTSHFL